MKLPAKIYSCDMYSIGLYVWLTHHLTSQDMSKLCSKSDLISKHIAMINGMAANDVDRALTHLESKELIIYEENCVTIKALQSHEICQHLISALDGMWSEWMSYRKKMRRSYIDQLSEQRQYDKLISECAGDTELAKNILANAIARKWQGWNTAVYLEEQTKIKSHNGTKPDSIGRVSRSELEQWIQQG
jgi:hypothetical protein